MVDILTRIVDGNVDPDVQREAVETLSDLHDEGNGVLDIVTALAADHSAEEVRAEAVETLADHWPPASAAPLFNRLLSSERSQRVRKELRDALEDLESSDG